MISALITLLVAALVLMVIYLVLQRFLPPDVIWIVGLILGLILLVYALSLFKLLPGL